MAEEARRSARFSRDQAQMIRERALAEADRALREIRVVGEGPGRSVFVDGGGDGALRAEVQVLRDEVEQLRREVERLRRDRSGR